MHYKNLLAQVQSQRVILKFGENALFHFIEVFSSNKIVSSLAQSAQILVQAENQGFLCTITLHDSGGWCAEFKEFTLIFRRSCINNLLS